MATAAVAGPASANDEVQKLTNDPNQWVLQTGNYAQALVRADALLRVYPEAGKILIPALTTIATDSRGAAAISGQLSTLPPWRSSFLAVLAEKADPTVTFSVLSQLNAGPAKPVDGEIAGYLGRLMALKQYDQAFLGWLLFMPQERLSAFRGVYDGDFDNLPGPQPFHWVLAGGVGGRVDIRPSASRPHDQALQVSYDGFSTPTLVYQWMVLPPGPQRLSMDALYDTPEAQNRLIWQVTCADSGAPLLQMKPQANGTWRHFSQTFTVPPTGCGAQQLILLPKAGDHTTSLSVWYDKLAVEPDTSGAG